MAKGKYGDNNVGIDISEFQRKAKAIVKVWKLEEKDFIKDQSRLLARETAKFTPPFAGGKLPDWHKGTAVGTKADIEAGENAIKNDIKQICFVVPDSVAMNEHIKSKGRPIYRNGVIVAPGVITNGFKLYRWHQDNKRANGRTRELDIPNMPWVGRELVNEYIKDVQKYVGVAKSAFLKVAMSFGDKGSAPAKIKRHLGRVKGSGRLVTTQKGTEGHLSGKADGLYLAKRKVPHLMRNRLEKAVKRLEILKKAAAKKAGFKVR